jgi:hypothetical protein
VRSISCGVGEWKKDSSKFDKLIIPIQRLTLGLILSNDVFLTLDIQKSLAEFNVIYIFFPLKFEGVITLSSV